MTGISQPLLFRRDPEQEKGDKAKDYVGDPNCNEGWKVAKSGKNGKYLHEKDVDKGERKTKP